MAIRTDFTYDMESSPRIITVAAPSTEVTIQDLHDTIVSFEDSIEGGQYPRLIQSSGKEDLGGGVLVGVTSTLQNAKLAFEARGGPAYTQCRVSGGNIVAVDDVGATIPAIEPTAFTQVIIANSSSATLQEQGAIQYSSFNGGVTVDLLSAYSGTDYPIGTPQQPVNNMTDALSIASTRGFTVFYVIGDALVDSGGDYRGLQFIGESQSKSQLTIHTNALVENSEFYDAHITGTLDGNAKLKNCLLTSLNYVHGYVEQCVLSAGTITLGGAADAHFLDCWSGVPGVATPVIDMGGTGQGLALRNYNGGIKIANKTGASDKISIDLNSGHVILDSTVTAGEIVIRGVGHVTDNSVGATVDTTGLVDATTINLIRKILQNRTLTDPATGQMTVYDDDDATTLLTADIFEDTAGATPYAGNGVNRRNKLS